MDLEDLRQKVEKHTPEMVEEMTGVPAKDLKRAAHIIGTTKSILSNALQGVYQATKPPPARVKLTISTSSGV